MSDWTDGLAGLGLELAAAQRAQFDAYLALLLDWNARLNLTAVREPEAIKRRHFYDSLTCATVMADLNGRHLIDVGTGAGFPGLPLKILFPNLRLTLVESVAKKAQFLEAVVAELKMSDVQIVVERAELLGQDQRFRERYDWALARAVAEMRVLVEYLLPLCRVGGMLLAQKGENAKMETAVAETAIQTLGGAAPIFHELPTVETEQPYYLVLVEKVTPTPLKYPRRVGIPSKRPL